MGQKGLWMLGYRNNDAVLTICQNNRAKSIEIIEVNETATALIGYTTADVQGRELKTIIPTSLAGLLMEYVEYEAEANDVGMVLSKVQNFSIKTKDKKDKNCRLKVVRGESTRDTQTFRLVLQDAVGARKDDALREMIRENFKGHEVLHPVLHLPNHQSLEKDIDLLIHYHRKAHLRASLVVMQLDYIAALERQYGEVQRVGFMKHAAQVCRNNLRTDDVIGVINDTRLGVLLLDSVSDSTRMVANRLRWQVAAHPVLLPGGGSVNLSASMVYANIDGVMPAAKLLGTCESELSALPANVASQLLEVG